MNTSIIKLLHLGYWLFYCLVITFLFVLSSDGIQPAFENWDDWLIILATMLLTGFISFYAFYGWLVPRYLKNRQLQQFLRWGLGVSIAITGLIIAFVIAGLSVVVSVVFGKVFFVSVSFGELFFLLIGSALVAVMNGLLGTVIRGFIMWYQDIHVKEMLANKTLRTELALLKAQINPHFLFNTLNNIDILIERDAPRASLYLNKLSDLLRFVLYETQAEQIPLTQELEYIQKYIELQKIRTTNEHYVTLQIDGEPDGLLIPPMLFVPYLENAFKYATNKKVNNAIRIQIRVNSEQIHFQCVNVIDKGKTAQHAPGGLGNDLIRQRLTLLYPNKHTLTIRHTGDDYSVDLLVPVKTHELSPH
ncbi:sensor histidine kinase [Larkinella rosea]|uniref:Histidine kinase n=1 Tax=Larkinella rosea TaxID=2025312 RepID=A0A3P1BA82_9BACT|nr:sensor histidine kinase [Larkinella rosea]RRA97732.1 histidine kinase [Larkinella rosea]